jgi:hypothetical protein
MILRVHCDASGLAHDPVIRQRLGPRGVDLKAGNVIGESRHCDDGSQKRRKKQPHDILPALTLNGFMVRRRALSRFGYSTRAMLHGPPRGLGPKQIVQAIILQSLTVALWHGI